MEEIHVLSGGVPRLINVVAHKAMLAAYGEGHHYVSAAHVRKAAGDTPSARRVYSPMVWIAAVATAIAAVAIYWYLKK